MYRFLTHSAVLNPKLTHCAFCSFRRKMEKHLLSEKIKNFAESLGIDAIGFAEASEFSDYVLNQQ